MEWKIPPKIKVYEALGAVADKRVHIGGNAAKVLSSSGNKAYDVIYDPIENAITANDNGSYWQKYLGYPGIAFLLQRRIIPHEEKWLAALAGIPWKDVNVQFKNDFLKTEDYVKELVAERGYNVPELEAEVNGIMTRIENMGLRQLGSTAKPPKGY